MTPDVKINNYYHKFKKDAKADVVEYSNKLNELETTKTSLYDVIVEHAGFYKDTYNLNLATHELEFVKQTYNSSLTLYNKVLKLYNAEDDANKANKLLQLLKYCNILRQVDECNKHLIVANKKDAILWNEYRKLIAKYYTEVHRKVLEGYGYKFAFGIGVFYILRRTLDPNKPIKRALDFNETNKNKRRLLAAGAKLYDEKEAEWHQERNLPYDGVQYRVYLPKGNVYYKFCISNSDLVGSRNIEFKHTEYVNICHKGKTHLQLSKECNTFDDIVNFDVDIKVKLNILLLKDPTKYLNFVRDTD
jgi:hypothetical protein